MKHKVADLDGALLDASVAKAEGLEWRLVEGRCCVPANAIGGGWMPYEPSWQWPEGGPIIEHERIAVYFMDEDRGWLAGFDLGVGDGPGVYVDHQATGQTALIAAMRAYVRSKFGDEVELP